MHDTSAKHTPSPKPLYWMSPPKKTWRLMGRANFRSVQAEQLPDEIEAHALRAREEWTTLVEAICAAGGDVLILPPHPRHDLTGLIYTAEAGLLVQPITSRPHLLLPIMTPPHRAPEASWIGQVAFLHYGWLASKHPTAHSWEAQGDVLYLDDITAIMTYGEGDFARTSKPGLELHAASVATHFICLKFKADPWFHGNTFLNIYHHATETNRRVVMLATEALYPGEERRLLAWLAEQDARTNSHTSLFTISTEESLAYATNSLQVGRTVIAPEGISTRCKALWTDALQLDVVELDLQQLFLKGGGAPVCLTCKLSGLMPHQVPQKFLWRPGAKIEDFENLI